MFLTRPLRAAGRRGRDWYEQCNIPLALTAPSPPDSFVAVAVSHLCHCFLSGPLPLGAGGQMAELQQSVGALPRSTQNGRRSSPLSQPYSSFLGTFCTAKYTCMFTIKPVCTSFPNGAFRKLCLCRIRNRKSDAY